MFENAPTLGISTEAMVVGTTVCDGCEFCATTLMVGSTAVVLTVVGVGCNRVLVSLIVGAMVAAVTLGAEGVEPTSIKGLTTVTAVVASAGCVTALV